MDYGERQAEEADSGSGVMQTMLERLRELKQQGVFQTPAKTLTSTVPNMTIQDALKALGHTQFRPGQEALISEIITSGDDGTLVICPTGWGKSLIFQIPALVLDGMAIIVSPLISLMKDQVDKLQSAGISTTFINSSLSDKDTKIALQEVVTGTVKIMYVAPERFGNATFNRVISNMTVGLMAIDEAHCISQWGNDFRRSYSRLGAVIQNVKPKRVIALTATATPEVQDDICESLGIPNAKRFVRGVYRSNLQLAIMSGYTSRLDAIRVIADDCQKAGHKTGIIYAATRQEAETTGGYLKSNGVDASVYHGGLKDSERTDIQNGWAQKGGIIVATVAFGMGIDRPDVRFVVHSGLSSSLEALYQEIGRAGRDGNEAMCLSLWDDGGRDYQTQMTLINITNPTGSDVRDFWVWLRGYAQSIAKPNCKEVTVSLTQKDMGQQSGCYNVGGCVSFLKKHKAIEKIANGEYKVHLACGNFDYTKLDNVRRDKIAKVDKVVEFYRTKGCRFGFICDYFGDTSFTGSCGSCDNCTQPSS